MDIGELFSVRGKRVVVTGGTSGIGLMIARAFVENGATVLISSRKAEVCASVAEELSRVGECAAVPESLSSEEGCRRLADAVGERWDALDVLVNNAGVIWGPRWPSTTPRRGSGCSTSTCKGFSISPGSCARCSTHR